MATHSSILAWRIPWGEESGRLQSMGPQRVGHNIHAVILIKLYITWILLNASTKPLTPALAMLAFFMLLKNSKLATLLRSFSKFIIFFYLFWAVLGLHCCMCFSLVAASRCYLLTAGWGVLVAGWGVLIAGWGVLVAGASLVAEHGLQGFGSCGFWALEHRLSSCGART